MDEETFQELKEHAEQWGPEEFAEQWYGEAVRLRSVLAFIRDYEGHAGNIRGIAGETLKGVRP